jgi:predicted metal-dependent phosphotriesterase family hydrolase
MKSSNWLQIPLVPYFHVGPQGVDRIGVETWEARYGRQIDHLEAVCRELGVNVFKLAGFDREVA